MTVHAPATGTGLAGPKAEALAAEGALSRRGKKPRRVRGDVTAKHLRDNKVAYLMLAPMIILLGIFVIWPLIHAFYLSTFTYSFYKPSVFVGLQYFSYVLTDPRFWKALYVSLRLAVMVVPTGMVIALLLALFIKTVSKKIAAFMKVTVYVPAVASTVVASVLFVFIYQDEGIANWFLNLLRLPPLAWLNDPAIALPAIAVPMIWLGLGLTTLIMLAGVLDIPDSYYESADLDGAGWFQQLVFITIPMLKNILLYLAVTGFVLTIQQFEIPLVMTGGGPTDATNTANLFIFNSFRDNTPYATSFSLAAALLLFIVITTISVLMFKTINSEKAVDS